ncbi:site-specific integrase [Xanthocytophaga agilis]|uniref:Site-specific integrase n=1 Tax=Xanthocytophaga agilis TaxID=3048010 RepID=A0AAE3RA43_9BACT|nr:site-specific integrase [Xanthocytophaga agilis]MDJ1503528.1 site-specific integrase [Xanthocytophaga agilis]
MNKATISINLDRRSSKQDGTYPIKLRIIFNRDFKRYGTGLFASDEEWEKLQQSRPKGKVSREQQEIELVKQKIETFKNKAQSILDDLEEFSYEEFEKEWFNKPKQVESIYSLFEAYILQLKEEKRVSTANSYTDTLHSLQRFKKSLRVEQVSVEFLKKYEHWMVSEGKSLTTVGIYARNIRSILNQAIAKELMKQENYPFNSLKGGYKIPKGSNIKRALSEIDLKRVLEYRPEDPISTEAKSLDFFVLSYLCNGANFKDICRWKYKNIVGDQLIFLRAKTERTTRGKPIQIKVFLSERIRQIIDKWSVKPAFQEQYIFPILKRDRTAEQEEADIAQFIKNTNKYLRRIAKKLEIEGDITTYTARHTFATRLKRKGASTEFIKESLGHQNILTTENYLDSFEDSERVKWANALLD